ncbi:MAG: DNA-directed RNA polymerase subunit alpha [Puniceicoccales bacterium]|jgi:DNA-directed RNA polymerase subunit alpha|nr:DNA-directed RNA polymerase subunit alpha [Puniceicoccales bacterium]
MIKRLGKFELPKKLDKIDDTATDTYSMYVAEPFESGYGHSIGNSLRRILLSSIEGTAISSIRIDGVRHEYQSIPGVVEDVIDIVLNLKKVLLKSTTTNPAPLYINVDKEGPVLASDIVCPPEVVVINLDQIICTINDKRKLHMNIEVKTGRGYSIADDNKKQDQDIGIIPIDSLFSPVKLAKYSVEDTRVGHMTDFDKLVLEIWTDGRISPDEALKDSVAIMKQHLDVFDTITDDIIEFNVVTKETTEEQNKLRILLNMSVNEIELSVRAANCLNNANITCVGELALKSEAEMLRYRNFGKKSLNEIKNKLEELGLSLGMKIDERLLDHPLRY